jgi:TctA family transporter
MLDLMLSTLVGLLTVDRMMFMMIGVTVGIFIGVLPGLGGIAGLSLMLPFVYGMEPIAAVAMLIGLLAVVPTADTFSSVLMGISGGSSAQATVVDGFPMAKRGEAARALSAAFFASMIGGLFGALVLTGTVIVARPLILSFGSAELFMLTLFGLSTVAALSGGNLAKGIAAASLGLVFGMVGAAPATGEYRLDFDMLYLSDGLQLTIVGLAVFALPEMFDLLRGGGSIAQGQRLGRGWLQGLRDTLAARWLVLRCSVIGSVVGIVPGIGNSVVPWLSYTHAVQTTKDKSQFGKGEPRGVIGPESANNATLGGDLMPTLMFGIPGSGSMALFLAGMVLLGLQPGPAMADRHLDVTYTIIWSLAIANVIGTALCIVLAPQIARLTFVRYVLVAPFMMLIITFAAFQATRSFSDLLALLVLGVLGMFLRRFGWSRAAFLIGFVLSTDTERYLYQAVQFQGAAFLSRPLVLVLIALTLFSLWVGIRQNKRNAISTEGDIEQSRAKVLWPQVAFTAVVLGFFAFAIIDGQKNSFLAMLFPVIVGCVGAVTAVMVLFAQSRGPAFAGTANFDTEAQTTDKGPWIFAAWFAGLIALTALIGFYAALLLFFVVFLRVIARSDWRQILVLTACAGGATLGLAWALNLVFPGGLLQAYFDLPWPFR